jgi:hypothetical protein
MEVHNSYENDVGNDVAQKQATLSVAIQVRIYRRTAPKSWPRSSTHFATGGLEKMKMLSTFLLLDTLLYLVVKPVYYVSYCPVLKKV